MSEVGRGASGIALDATHVYLKSLRGEGVYSVPKSGGELTRFDGVPPPFRRTDRISDSRYEYRLESAYSDRLARFACDGTSDTLVSGKSVEAECFAIAQSQGVLYWTDANGALMSLGNNTGDPMLVAQTGASDCDDDYEGLAVEADETWVYWIAGQPGHRTSDEEPLFLFRTCR